jgi:predicted component of type VI protein secretion system
VRPETRCSACQAVWEKEFKFCPDCGAPASGRLGQLKLVVRCSGGRQQEVLLDGSTVVLGSGPEATLQVSDPYVSRKHCQFTPTADGDYQVEDLSSANGTFVRTSGPTPVTPGSEFLVGSSLISVKNA